MSKPAVFVGSSREGLEIARAVQFQLKDDALVTVWDEGAFGLGQSTLESLAAMTERFDFAVLIITPDDVVATRQVSAQAPRDNVMFELGFFMGRLGRSRTFAVCSSTPDLKLPSDLAGVTMARFDHDDAATDARAALGPACFAIRRTIHELGTVEGDSFFVSSYERSQHPEFFREARNLIQSTKEITLVGSCLNLLWEDDIVDALVDRARRGMSTVRICLANPFSPYAMRRYVEEENGGWVPACGQARSAKLIEALLKKIRQSGTSTIALRLFEHFPTLATMCFDADIFIYPYGHLSLGTHSPLFHFRHDGSPEAEFLVRNAQRIWAGATSAEDILRAREDPKAPLPGWIEAAVFAIPAATTSFYKFGVSVVDYDIRLGKRPEPPGRSHVLGASPSHIRNTRPYGFHMRLADPLYFASEAQLDAIRAELRRLSTAFPPFRLICLRLVEQSFYERTIEVIGDDDAGVVESLHHELFWSTHMTAVSSMYRIGDVLGAPGAQESKRDQLMIALYGSPNVLARHRPSFALLSPAPEDAHSRESLLHEMDELLQGMVPSRDVVISSLCLACRRPGQPYWTLLEECGLTGSTDVSR